MEDISKKYKTSYNSQLAMPMEFERIVNEYLENTYSINPTADRRDIYLQIKRAVANQVSGVTLPPAAIHYDIPFDSIDCILTSNYDKLIEQAYQFVSKSSINLNNNFIKYIDKYTSTDEKIYFFHPHGIIDYPLSICLGYEHYMGVVEHLRSEINSVSEKNKKKIREMKICSLLSGNPSTDMKDKLKGSWYERFYSSNLAFVGFGLPDCETDIWWLLTHRAYLYNTNYNGIRGKISNTIVYFDIIDNVKKKKAEDEEWRLKTLASQQNKHDLLEKLHLKVIKLYLDIENNFETKYREIFKLIEDKSCWG